MIISFDGNVFAGKTTLIDYLAGEIKCRRVAEQTFFIGKIKKEKNYPLELREHLRYLQADRLRIKMIGEGINLLDRSFVSLSAHVYALYYYSGIDLREKHMQFLQSLLSRGKIIVPDIFVFVFSKRIVAHKRFLADRRDGGRGTPAMYLDKNYYYAVEKFNLLWQKGSKRGCVVEHGKVNYKSVKTEILLTNKKNKRMPPTEIINLTEAIFFNNYENFIN